MNFVGAKCNYALAKKKGSLVIRTQILRFVDRWAQEANNRIVKCTKNTRSFVPPHLLFGETLDDILLRIIRNVDLCMWQGTVEYKEACDDLVGIASCSKKDQKI